MHRRDFVKAAAGILAFPLLPNIPMIHHIPTVDLMDFCDPLEFHGARFHMKEPFVQEGTLCATDAAVGVLVNDAGDYSNRDEGKRLPPILETFNSFWKPDQKWTPWPEADYVADSDSSHGCYMCLRTGVIANRGDCKACEGSGADYSAGPFTWEYEDEAPVCKSCHGTGFSGVLCPRCKGKPFDKELPSKQALDGRLIAARYHNAIAKLPGVEFIASNANDGPITFRFDGGKGLLMPLIVGRG